VRLLAFAVLTLAISCCAFGQAYSIQTFAGGGMPVNVPGTSTSLHSPNAVAVDGAGNVFISDQGLNAIFRLDAATGVLTVAAGNGTYGDSGDGGPATSAQLANPYGVAVDAAGNLYIAQQSYPRIRKVSNGVITTVAGTGTYGFSGDNGPAVNAQLSGPTGVAVDAAGNLYIADVGSRRIRRITNGVIATVAGNGATGYSGDNGPAASAELYYPFGVAVDSAGNLYIADVYNQRIRKVANGVITTVAGNGTQGYSGDNGPAAGAELYYPFGVAVDSAGNLYIADTDNNRIRKVANGVITTVAGSGGYGLGGDQGPATSAQLTSPIGAAVDASGSLYIADQANLRVRKVANGVITTVAGGGSVADDNRPATSAQLFQPQGVAADSAGGVYIADTHDYRVRKVANGVITTVAGGGGAAGDNGPATSAQLLGPIGVAVDSAGNLYIADGWRIRKVSNGAITTVAGNGTPGFSGDNGPATAAQVEPGALAVDSAGNLYIAEPSIHSIRKVSQGVITTVAGTGTQGYSGDNGPAAAAQLAIPWGVAVDSDGNLYIADSGNHRVRKVSNGIITTVAGSGMNGTWGDNGPATTAQLEDPYGLAVDSAGNLYIADWATDSIRKVSNGMITTVAGNGTFGFSGDGGPAAGAQLYHPQSVAADGAGNVYIADTANNRVRVLTPAPTIGAVTNAASNLSGAVSPGEIVALYGSNIGPAQLVTAAPGASGSYGTQVANTSVSFNGIQAPIIYAGAAQTAAILPYGITGSAAQATVTYQGLTSAAFSVPVASSAPGIFTYDSSGQGPAAAVNQDGVTVNTAATPTKIGDIISLYATGEGQTTPAGVDGKPASVPYPQPNLTVTATVGGQNAQVKYAGGAPGEVAGLMQVNVQIPAGIATGDAVPVVLRVGSASSQGGVTIAVR
jgi:uncharacterized protein (TIGR03437 family)